MGSGPRGLLFTGRPLSRPWRRGSVRCAQDLTHGLRLPPAPARIVPDNRSGVEASQHVPGPAAFLGRGVVLAGAGLNLRMAKKT